MNNRGVTIVELLIVIVVAGLLAAFSIVAVGTIIENQKEESFINTARTMITAASNAFSQNDALFDDNIATMQELIDGNYIQVPENDPWGQPYDTVNSYVVAEIVAYHNEEVIYLSNSYMINSEYSFKVKLISPTATIGYDDPLQEFDGSNVIYADGRGGSIIDGIVESITGNVTSSVTGDNNNDSITVDSNIQGSGTINTFDGNDVVAIAGDVKNRATVNTGAGDDTITLDRLRGRSTIDAGEGDDSVVIREIRYHTILNTGDGNDVVSISSVTSNYRGSVNMGAGDDTLTIRDGGTPFSGVNGSFTGGAGTDILNLPDVDTARWNQISHMFSGFETINLSDSTITN
jgi:type IV pilus assembly protein PilA